MSDGQVYIISWFVSHTLKPIFHCDAKPFVLGTFALPNANIPTCWYIFTFYSCKAHIPLETGFALGTKSKWNQHKKMANARNFVWDPTQPIFHWLALGVLRWVTRKVCVTQRKTPNASQWNIGCVGSQTQISCVGHVHFMFFVLISFVFGTQRKPSFQWNMGFTVWDILGNKSVIVTGSLKI